MSNGQTGHFLKSSHLSYRDEQGSASVTESLQGVLLILADVSEDLLTIPCDSSRNKADGDN